MRIVLSARALNLASIIVDSVEHSCRRHLYLTSLIGVVSTRVWDEPSCSPAVMFFKVNQFCPSMSVLVLPGLDLFASDLCDALHLVVTLGNGFLAHDT